MVTPISHIKIKDLRTEFMIKTNDSDYIFTVFGRKFQTRSELDKRVRAFLQYHNDNTEKSGLAQQHLDELL
jgi:hypothetical protein